jgi:UDP-galactopyranose mutase
MMESYRLMMAAHPNVIFGGRLGSYKYLDMHQAIGAALKTFEHQVNPFLTGMGRPEPAPRRRLERRPSTRRGTADADRASQCRAQRARPSFRGSRVQAGRAMKRPTDSRGRRGRPRSGQTIFRGAGLITRLTSSIMPKPRPKWQDMHHRPFGAP